jgi:hypothetical protein
MIDTTDLADELADRFDLTRAAAREGVDVYLGQINDIDGTTWDQGSARRYCRLHQGVVQGVLRGPVGHRLG